MGVSKDVCQQVVPVIPRLGQRQKKAMAAQIRAVKENIKPGIQKISLSLFKFRNKVGN